MNDRKEEMKGVCQRPGCGHWANRHKVSDGSCMVADCECPQFEPPIVPAQAPKRVVVLGIRGEISSSYGPLTPEGASAKREELLGQGIPDRLVRIDRWMAPPEEPPPEGPPTGTTVEERAARLNERAAEIVAAGLDRLGDHIHDALLMLLPVAAKSHEFDLRSPDQSSGKDDLLGAVQRVAIECYAQANDLDVEARAAMHAPPVHAPKVLRARAEALREIADLLDEAIKDENVKRLDAVVEAFGGPTQFECDTRLLGYFGALYRAAQDALKLIESNVGVQGDPYRDALNVALSLPPDIEAAVEGPRGHRPRGQVEE